MARILYYPCPYCKKRMTRQDMVPHIERKHNQELPEHFSALRMTFHVVNKKDLSYSPKCRICGKPTSWDEKKGRYNVLCDNPACRTAWIQKMKDTMGDKYGKYRPTETVEGLEKMLQARSISGKYKFRDSAVFTYTGSYELSALKFLDQVLEIKSEDLQTPGPIMQYELNGKLHYYIPDMYYIPYNLIIEVKDGGSRPNKNTAYAGTRERQMAKEKHVIEKTNYNYLRLTDNNLSQILAVFADLKMQLVENTDKRIIHVNEDAFDPDGELITEAEVGETTSNLVQKIFNVVSDDGRDNAVCRVKGYAHLLRGRSTMIVLRKGGKSYQAFYHKKLTKWDAPGGGWDPGETPETAAVRETQEEARITVKNVLSCGYMIQYHHAVAPWVMKHVKNMSEWWYGYYTELFVGMFASTYNGHIEEHDKDPILDKGKWYNIEDIIHHLNANHRKAIYKYLEEKEHFDLKASMGEEKKENAVKENMFAGIQGMMLPAKYGPNDVTIVNYMQNNVFAGESEPEFAVSASPRFTKMFYRDKSGKLAFAEASNILKNSKYDVYVIRNARDRIFEELISKENMEISRNYIYETVFEHKMYTYDQILFEKTAIKYPDIYAEDEKLNEAVQQILNVR